MFSTHWKVYGESVHCKKRGVTEHPRGAIFYCFRGNSMGYHGNSKILLPWGVQLHCVFYSVVFSKHFWAFIFNLAYIDMLDNPKHGCSIGSFPWKTVFMLHGHSYCLICS